MISILAHLLACVVMIHSLQKVDYHALHGDVLALVNLEAEQCPGVNIRNIPVRQFDPGHPVDTYLLFKHWIEAGSSDTTCYEDIRQYLPTKKDLKNVAFSLVRLQQIYELSEGDVAKGDIDGEQSTLELEADDIQIIGQAALEQMNFPYFHAWYRLALGKARTDAARLKVKDSYRSLILKE